MDIFKDLTVDKNVVSVTYKSKSPQLTNLLLRAIESEVETYAVTKIIFDENTSSRYDEIIGFRLSHVPIDHTKYKHIDNKLYKYNITGPIVFKVKPTDDIPFSYETPIVTLKKGETLSFSIMIEKGTGKHNVRFRPVSQLRKEEISDGFKITFKTLGMLPPMEILNNGLNKIKDAEINLNNKSLF